LASQSTDLLQFYRSEIKFETELLSNRLNALISSQSFLVIAYATSMSALFRGAPHPFILVLSVSLTVLGLVLSLHAWPGIRAAYAVIEHWHVQQGRLLAQAEGMEAYRDAFASALAGGRHGGPEERFREGTLFAKRTPWIFALAWCHFGVLAVLLYLRS